MKKSKKKDIVTNILNKIDVLAKEYRENPTPYNLSNFIDFRTDVFEIVSKLHQMKIYPCHPDKTLWNTECYLSVVTDELEIFDIDRGKSVPQDEFVKILKKWRKRY